MPTTKNANESTTLPPLGRRPRRPTTLTRTKNALGTVVVQLQTGELDPKRANALVYALATLAGVITSSEVERRLAVLEGHVANPAPWRPGASLPPLSSSPAPREGSKQ
jgi:hypothetical protein